MDKKNSILIIEDNEGVVESLKILLEDKYHIESFPEGQPGYRRMRNKKFNLVLLDITLPDTDGFILLSKIKGSYPHTPVIMLTGLKSVKATQMALEGGAEDFITKPFNNEELLMIIKRTIKKGKGPQLDDSEFLDKEKFDFSSIITRNDDMYQVLREIFDVSKTNSTVLITGESGTGKELIARCIHNNSKRKHRRFIPIHCAAIPSELLESELFGYEKGAFTGAVSNKSGKFEIANKGTIFLDEIGTLPLKLQVKLLRVLQEQKFERIGSNKTIKVNLRIISATNMDLKSLIKTNEFREDLYYRLNVVPIKLPSLRERKTDIAALVRHFTKIFCKKARIPEKIIIKDVLEIFIKYPWPGNIRELENTIERMIAFSNDKYLSVKDIPLDILTDIKEPIQRIGRIKRYKLKIAIGRFEKEYILRFLNRTGWQIGKTSKILGIHRNSLCAKMKKFKLKKPSK
ncbi:sigma-54-dependent Fis family transcriptional regulator [Candidatus Dependentiae bacterium]|nr:sigma-54-dependent Fis family transcriptional regulator [Candidatus Dependentiae bacterium]